MGKIFDWLMNYSVIETETIKDDKGNFRKKVKILGSEFTHTHIDDSLLTNSPDNVIDVTPIRKQSRIEWRS
jgi:hypothetical protein